MGGSSATASRRRARYAALRGGIIAWIVLFAAGAATAREGTVVLSGVAPSGADGGEYQIAAEDDVTPAQRAAIQARLEVAAAALTARGGAGLGTSTPVKLGWPLAPAPHLDVPGYHGISSFVDLDDAFPRALLDYNCGARTYDLASGYNHGGIDIFLWPFAWNKMDDDDVHVVAAAPGVILDKQDGHYDRNCDFSNPNWNAVYVMHADGTVAWYGHLKRHSVTSKNVGDPIGRGEYIGVVGSSGNSTGPHLHFEVHDADGHVIDPHAGPCNELEDSRWLAQRPYYDSAINEVTTGAIAPSLGSCPEPSMPNRQDTFARGSTVYFTSYYRDLLGTQTSTHTIKRPNGSSYSAWLHTSPNPHYSAAYWYWYYTGFAASGPSGIWRYEIQFEDETYVHEFTVLDPGDVPSNTPTSTRTASATRTRTPTRTITPTWTISPTRTISPTWTISPTRTITYTPSVTFTPTVTRTPSNTRTGSPTWTASATRTATLTPSATSTASPSPLATATATETATHTATATETETPEPTATLTSSRTPSDTPIPTLSATATPTPTATDTVVATETATPLAGTPTPRSAATATHRVAPSPTVAPEATATAVTRTCTGDCAADGLVSVDDLVRAVNIALGRTALRDCPAAARNGDTVEITDLVVSVNNALRGCARR